MKRIGLLIALGVLAYVVFALVTLPASVVVQRLEPYGVRAGGVTGTAWNGSAQVVQIGQINVGSVKWDLHVLPLFTLRGAADIDVRRVDGFAKATVAVRKDRVDFTDLTASLPIAALPPSVAPGGWTGTINARLASLTLENNWPTNANGTLDVAELTGPANRPANIGSYQLKFPAQGSAPGVLKGSINDTAGPIQIAGTVELKAADRSYLLDGLVATKPDAPRDFARTLEYLGPPDAQGRRQFSLSGTM
jgi:general secretion pathway protein N